MSGAFGFRDTLFDHETCIGGMVPGYNEDTEMSMTCIRSAVVQILGLDKSFGKDSKITELQIILNHIGYELDHEMENNKDISRFLSSPYESVEELLGITNYIESNNKKTLIFKDIIKGISDFLGIDKSVNVIEYFNEAIKKLEEHYKIFANNQIDKDIVKNITRMLKAARKEIQLHESEKDLLTGLYQRRKGLSKIEERLLNLKNTDISYLLIIDIDNFKKINDTYGHNIGDDVIKTLGKYLKERFRRSSDITLRYGGEEFLVYIECKGNNDSENKRNEDINNIKDTILSEIRELEIELENGEKINLTVSGGLVSYSREKSLEENIGNADKLLYNAKHRGRNQIISLL